MTCLWWQLTHNITLHTIRLSLKESCLEIHVKKVPTLAGCHLATHPKSWSCGSRWICLLIFLLFFWENLSIPILPWPWRSYPVCPSWWYARIFWLRSSSVWPSSDQQDRKLHYQPKIYIPSVLLQQTDCNILLHLLLRLLFVHRISFLLYILLPRCRLSYIVPTHLEFDHELLLVLQLD